jgi:CubicO group peptidase (beta-lactamase class C family)
MALPACTTPPTTEKIDAVVTDEMAKQNIVGMAVGIVRNGKIYYASGYGHADFARKTPITVNTIFRWASISKTLTATAALKLDEESTSFNLNDHVTKHVSYWPKSGNKGDILIEHLLSNRSGIIQPNKPEDCPDNSSPAISRQNHSDTTYNAKQGVEVFKNQDLCFNPGDSYKYSTFGFSLLGSAIEEAAGKSYADYVNDKIKTPLGMSSLRQATGTRKGFAQQCQILKEVSVGNSAWKLPGGGWESNIIDLAKFANGLLQGSLLKNTSRLWTTVTGNSNYGYGIKHAVNKSRAWHDGTHDNTRTLLYLYPKSVDSLGVVLMINGDDYIDPLRISHHLADLFGQNHGDLKNPVVKTCSTGNCLGKFSAVWRKTDNDVLLRRGYNHDDFYAEWEFLRQAGYYTDDFEPYVENGKVLWDAIFRKGSGGNAMWRTFDKKEFSDKWQEQSGLNYRLVDLETYVVNGKRKWAGLFRPGSGKYAMFRYFNTNDFGAKKIEMANNGLKLIDVEAFSDGEKLEWAGVWVEGEDVLLNRNKTTDDFGNLVKLRRENGWKLIDIERYRVGAGVRWAGIWEKSSDEEKLNRGYPYCGTKDHDGDWLSM